MKREGSRTLRCGNPLVFNKVSTSSQKGADSNSPFWVDPDSSGTFGWFPVSSTAGNYCSWDT